MTDNIYSDSNMTQIVYDLEYMKQVITSSDTCYEFLEEVKLISLDSQFAKWDNLVNTQETVVGIALNVLPEIKYEVEQAIIEVLQKKIELKQQQQQEQQQQQQPSKKTNDNVTIIVDIIEFMSLCEFYSNASTQLQDLLFQFQKQFLPFHEDLADKMFKIASISRPTTTIDVNKSVPATANKGKRRK